MKIYSPKSNWMNDERLHVPSMTVLEQERGWRKTGLLDASGVELMSIDSSEPVGFVTVFEKKSKKIK